MAEVWSVERIFDSFTRLGERRDHKAATFRRRAADAHHRPHLMGNPELILVDEPTEGLLPWWPSRCWRCCRISRQGVTILMWSRTTRRRSSWPNLFHHVQGTHRFPGRRPRVGRRPGGAPEVPGGLGCAHPAQTIEREVDMRKGLLGLGPAAGAGRGVGAWAGGTINWGHGALSGTFKDIGDRYLEGVQYAAEVLNAKGGINGMKLEVIPVDSELNPAVAPARHQAAHVRWGASLLRWHRQLGGRGHGAAGQQPERPVLHLRHGAASLTATSAQELLPGLRQHRQPVLRPGVGGPEGLQKVSAWPRTTPSARRRWPPHQELAELNPQAKIVGTALHPSAPRTSPPT